MYYNDLRFINPEALNEAQFSSTEIVSYHEYVMDPSRFRTAPSFRALCYYLHIAHNRFSSFSK